MCVFCAQLLGPISRAEGECRSFEIQFNCDRMFSFVNMNHCPNMGTLTVNETVSDSALFSEQ